MSQQSAEIPVTELNKPKSLAEELQTQREESEKEYKKAQDWLRKAFSKMLNTEKNRLEIPTRKIHGKFGKLAFEDFKRELRDKNYIWTESYDLNEGDYFSHPEYTLIFEK